MKTKPRINDRLVKNIEGLSMLNVGKNERDYLVSQFNETLSVVEKLDNIDTKKIAPTNHVTGLSNVYREDEIEKERVLTQEEALSNSTKNYGGYFMVNAVFENE